jgi:hypothetical protein
MMFSYQDPEFQEMLKRLERSSKFERYKDSIIRGTLVVIVGSIIFAGTAVTILYLIREIFDQM